MNTGIVMIGLALVMISAGLLVSPSHAAGPDSSCIPGCGIAFFAEDPLGGGLDAGVGGERAVYPFSPALREPVP
ncbi:MAG TPA: hypothetical protein VHN82_02745 [Methanoregula sp.]|nr:hypothetical protein [Methanoregula sp.]